MARLIVVDPHLQGYRGHHYNLNLAIIEQAKRWDMEVATLANINLTDRDIVSTLQAVPVFEHDQYRVPTMGGPLTAFGADDPARNPLYQPVFSAKLNQYFLQRLNNILTPVVSSGDVVVFHSLTANIVTAAATWLMENYKRQDFRTIFFMISADYEAPDGSRGWQTPVYEGFLKQLAEFDPKRVDISAETAPIAADLTRLSEGKVVVGESPHLKPVSLLGKYFGQPPRERGDGPECIASYIGDTRFERGSQLMPGVVDRLADIIPERLQLTIQVDYAALDVIQPGLADTAQKAYSRSGVTAVNKHLPIDDYYEHLKAPDVIIFPYLERYEKCGSGVFWETFAMGKPMVAPRSSLMAALNPGCSTFDEPTEESVASAVRRAVDGHAAHAALAREAGERWQREHDPTAFFDRFFGDTA